MSSSSPPPPPPPNHNSNPFSNSHSKASSSRPNPRRSKTTSNPETSWRREPLNDVTNYVLGGVGGRGNERRSSRIPSTSSPPTSPTQLQNHYLNHNLPRSSPPRLRRTYTALDLEGGRAGERVIGRGFMELGLGGDRTLRRILSNGESNDEGEGGRESRLRSRVGEEGGSTRSVAGIRRTRQFTSDTNRLGRGEEDPRRSRTLRDVLENSPQPGDGGEGEDTEGVDGNGRRLRRRRTEGGFR